MKLTNLAVGILVTTILACNNAGTGKSDGSGRGLGGNVPGTKSVADATAKGPGTEGEQPPVVTQAPAPQPTTTPAPTDKGYDPTTTEPTEPKKEEPTNTDNAKLKGGGLKLSCTQAKRMGNNEPEILYGERKAVVAVGTGNKSDNQVRWGLRCVEPYQKTGCAVSSQNSDNDLYPSTDGCITDNEEFRNGEISITCCTLLEQ